MPDNRISDIFKTKKDDSTPVSSEMISDKKREQETYKQWGTRCAGQANASVVSLRPLLQVVVCQQKREQQEDTESQEKERLRKRTKIEQLRADIAIEEDNINREKQLIDESEREIAQKKKEIADIREGNNKNRIATVNFWIGTIISILLAVYLFIFYSSASFSAFFRDGNLVEVGTALFYPQAFADAWNTSIGVFLLILLMPVIFLGLGFLIHQFTSKQDANNVGWKLFFQVCSKYIKITSLYVVTFIFDALLAFSISKKMYDAWVLNQMGEYPPYSWKLAFGEADFWIIIFSGFIAYVIWGLVFDFTMDSYSEKTENKNLIVRLNKDIDALKGKINQSKERQQTSNQMITQRKSEIRGVEYELEMGVAIDVLKIQKEINNFMSGWLAYMSLMAMPQSEQEEAKRVSEEIIQTLNFN